MAYLTQGGVEIGVNYGVEWKKAWIIKYPCPYIDFYKKDLGSKQGLYYVDLTGESFNLELNKMTVEFSVKPFVKAGVSMDIAAVVHGGFHLSTEFNGSVKFGYAKPSLIGTYALNNVSRMTAEVGIGLKDVRILGFSLGDLGKTWTFDLVDPIITDIIPETKFCEIKLK